MSAAVLKCLSMAAGLLVLGTGTVGSAQAPPCDASCQAVAGRFIKREGPTYIEGTVTIGPSAVARGASTVEDAPAVVGHGTGAESACAWRPMGPIAEVAAAQAAINAGQMPSVADPSTDGVVALVPGVIDMVGARTDWYRVTGTTAQIYQEQICDGVRTSLGWFDLVADGAGGLVVQVSAQDLVPGAYAQVVRQLPTPIPRIGPADEDEHGYAYVNTPVIFWLDAAAGQWAPVVGSASAGGVTVTVEAAPTQLVVDPGDGTEPLRCDEFRPVLRAHAVPGAEFPPAGACVYRYRDSSSVAPNGETWPVTVSVAWHVTWSANTGQGGDLGFVATASAVRQLPVAEIQALITDTHPDTGG